MVGPTPQGLAPHHEWIVGKPNPSPGVTGVAIDPPKPKRKAYRRRHPQQGREGPCPPNKRCATDGRGLMVARQKTRRHDPSWLKLEQSHPRRSFDEGGSTEFTFYAEQRGAYLIVVADNSSALPLTIQHPKKTCHIFGNGSCELVTSPDEVYTVKIFSPQKKPASFTLLVTHSEGKGRFEGQATAPVELRVGFPHRGSVGIWESSHYAFTGTRDGIYTIALSGGRSNLAWRLFDREAFDIILQQCDTHAGAGAETCPTAPLAAKKRYFLKVEEMSGVPGEYQLRVMPP